AHVRSPIHLPPGVRVLAGNKASHEIDATSQRWMLVVDPGIDHADCYARTILVVLDSKPGKEVLPCLQQSTPTMQ
ncbi:hypothetical protein, partial [Rhizobium johnstonii]|uniref:hypothetical protein n=1 Tax=Rhizobium johnstonii TaxID=3019933 RepID=UPI003F999A40